MSLPSPDNTDPKKHLICSYYLSSAMTIVSSPGKVLLAGGYLVLDQAYSGLVVSTSSRFYTVVADAATTATAAASARSPIQIRVRSPQFVDATWVYLVHVDDAAVRVEQLADECVRHAHFFSFYLYAQQY
jgi:phosphomevalonate kinase